MADIYQSFLRAPNRSLVASDAALHYVTTTTSIIGADAIFKHIDAHSREVEKEAEKVLSSIEGSNSACIETETTYTFRSGGGVILPNMDANMLADTTAVLPMVHVVSLDANGKIAQIRIHWDQGTALKQVEAIGKTGRNWPIRDGKAQVKTIVDSINAKGQAPASSNGQAGAAPTSNGAAQRKTSGGRPVEDYTQRLFSPPQEERTTNRTTSGGAPRASSRPQPRQWGELFAGDEDEGAPAGQATPGAGMRSPHQPVFKSGAGKHYQPNRLFDGDEDDQRSRSPERKKVDPSKYQHFDFNDEESTPQPAKPMGIRGKKQVNNWDFEDFHTPAKHIEKHNPGQQRHFGYGIDEDDQPSPPKREIKHVARKDADQHFEISDELPAGTNQPLKSVTTNIDSSRRQKDHDPHYSIKDVPSSPHGNVENQAPKSNTNAAFKPRSDMSSNWNFSEMEKPADQPQKIYRTAGNGMGGRTGQRIFDIGEDDEAGTHQYGSKGGDKQVYKTAGNGMGGRKGAGRGWSIGDVDE